MDEASQAERKFWVSWYTTEPIEQFELRYPWWVSGYRTDGASTICAAVLASSQSEAKEIVRTAYDTPPAGLEWRFAEERSADWSPFCDRFQRVDWMRWPVSE